MSSAGADRALVIRHGTLIDGSGRPPVINVMSHRPGPSADK